MPDTSATPAGADDSTDDPVDDLLAFLSASPSPYHAVAEAASRLDAAGFDEAHESDRWTTETIGVRGYVRRGASLVAWVGDSSTPAQVSFRVVGAHTDSPNLRIKPQPESTSAGWSQLGVEVYGGALLNSWLDRDLGLSGRVGVRIGPSADAVEVRLARDDRPLLRVPQLAIHLDRDITSSGLKLNPQLHLQPVWGLGDPGPGAFAGYLAELLGVDATQVLSWDVMAHDLAAPTRAGRHDELISSPRLDNQLSCWAGLTAITGLAPPQLGAQTTAVLALFDHEEIGSVSASGADSDLLPTVLERLVLAGGGDRSDVLAALARSRAVSADGAHATHPNYPERHDPGHPVAVNGGPVIKHNANVRYASDAATVAWFASVCADAGVPVQHFVSRDDMPCGSTIGPITAARAGLPTVDVGVAQLAMHSARELCGADDPALLVRALAAAYRA